MVVAEVSKKRKKAEASKKRKKRRRKRGKRHEGGCGGDKVEEIRLWGRSIKTRRKNSSQPLIKVRMPYLDAPLRF